jgi:Xaa-Pro aminopeptidase
MKRTTKTETELQALCDEMIAAEKAHAAVLKWNHATKRFDATVSDAELDALYAKVVAAQNAYTEACGE